MGEEVTRGKRQVDPWLAIDSYPKVRVHAAWLALRGASAGGFVFSHVVSTRWLILVVLLVSADLPGFI